jgi:hypothetical protein
MGPFFFPKKENPTIRKPSFFSVARMMRNFAKKGNSLSLGVRNKGT